MLERIYMLICCHFLGDYVLQNDFLARSKGENWWHMLAHCVLYSLPFSVAFGFDWRVPALITTHIVIDGLKARWKLIGYATDQILHLFELALLYIS